MIYVICEIHGINGLPVGEKIYVSSAVKRATIKVFRRIYANIVKIEGKLVKL
uniref:Uncharacterized protein n=1 Tax=viral metagenome TaxID=1070528 RepID=A0A6H1Z8K4_9ZZZZ